MGAGYDVIVRAGAIDDNKPILHAVLELLLQQGGIEATIAVVDSASDWSEGLEEVRDKTGTVGVGAVLRDQAAKDEQAILRYSFKRL
jgi:hypothetical protein